MNVYLRNRFYSPDIGRFISSDPLGMVDGPNTYGFCGGDPVNRSDPMGTDWEWSDGKWVEVAPFGTVEKPTWKGRYEGQFYPHRGNEVLTADTRTWSYWWYDVKQWIGEKTGLLGGIGETENQVAGRLGLQRAEFLDPALKADREDIENRHDMLMTIAAMAIPAPTPGKFAGPVKGMKAAYNWLVLAYEESRVVLYAKKTYENSRLVRSSVTGLKYASFFEANRYINRDETPQPWRFAANWATVTVGTHAFSFLEAPASAGDFRKWATTFKWNSTGGIGREDLLFRGTTEGWAGRYGVSPSSTDPAVATYFAVQAETANGGSGVIYVIPRSAVQGRILPPQRNALSYEYEVPLDIKPLDIPAVSIRKLSTAEARALLESLGIEVPARVYTPQDLTRLLEPRAPTTPQQIQGFQEGL